MRRATRDGKCFYTYRFILSHLIWSGNLVEPRPKLWAIKPRNFSNGNIWYFTTINGSDKLVERKTLWNLDISQGMTV